MNWGKELYKRTIHGEDFREDMIIRISENEWQKKIKEWEEFTYALREWGTVGIE